MVFYETLKAGKPFNLHLLTIQDDGTTTDLLYEGGSQYPHISPDGKKVYLGWVDDLGEDYTLDVAQRVMKPFSNVQASSFTTVADWSPDSSEVLFISSVGGWPLSEKGPGVYSLDLHTGESRLIRQASVSEGVFEPTFSPDGKRIALFIEDESVGTSSTAQHLEPSLSLRVMCADGRHETQITPASLFSSDYGAPFQSFTRQPAPPIWSPRGDEILFHAWFETEEGGGIYIVNVDGSNLRKLADTADYGLGPFPSPPMALGWASDGQRVAYSFDARVWVQDADGANRVEASARFGDPAQAYRLMGWTHSGQIVVLVETIQESSVRSRTMYTLDLESGETVELLSLDDAYYPSDELIWVP
jgi:Tol biopolymer transport system component